MKRLAENVRSASIITAIIFLPTSAAAEVCDKEVPGWDHMTGPVSELSHLMGFAFSPIGLILMGLLLSAMVLRNRWVALFGVGLSVACLAGLIANYFDHSHIYAASIREGCRASPVLTICLLVAFTILFVWRAKQLQNWRTKQTNNEMGKP